MYVYVFAYTICMIPAYIYTYIYIHGPVFSLDVEIDDEIIEGVGYKKGIYEIYIYVYIYVYI
jgi:hypothetical protein